MRGHGPPLRRAPRLVAARGRGGGGRIGSDAGVRRARGGPARRPAGRARDRRGGRGGRAPSCSCGPGPPPLGTLGDPDLDRVVARDALAELAAGLTSTRHYGRHGEARERDVGVFIETLRRAARGWSSSARSTSPPPSPGVAKLLGYHVTVCDARAVFATRGAVPDGRRSGERVAGPLLRRGRTSRSDRVTRCAC